MNTMNAAGIDQKTKPLGTRLPLTPARRLALVIGVPVCLGLAAAGGYSLVSNVGTGKLTVNYTIPASASRVSVSVSAGNVVLRQVSHGQGGVTGSGSYSLIRPRITERYSGGEASFGYTCRDISGNCYLNASVKVPSGAAVSVSTNGGNVTAYGITGATGRVSLSADGGDVTASQVAGVLSLSTDGGDIHATGVASTQVTANTDGGDIEIVFTRPPGDVKVTTDGGNITIVVPHGTTSYDVSTSADGGNITDSVPIDTSSPNRINATTSGGDITIRQAGT
jgi:hypothetical protein